jgi:membrane protein
MHAARRLATRTHERSQGSAARSRAWIEGQNPSSRRGVAITAWRRYRRLEGPLQSLLLSTYVFLAVLPALLVMVEYLEASPAALAEHIVHHFGLSAPTASLLRGVLIQDRTHELGSALLAIAGALFFGLGYGRVLQLVYTRAWQLRLPPTQTDHARYAVVLLALYGLIWLLLVQATELAGTVSWAGLTVSPGWVALLLLYFVWAPRFLMHGLVARRDLLPGAALTALGLVVLMIFSSFVMEFWIDFYAKDYGGFGVVMALFFWLGLSSFVVVAAASLSPALAERRSIRGARVEG